MPHDILRISGLEAVQNYLVREIQSVYRSQRVDIDDKHIEITISQMLRKVKVETMGDTGLLPGSVIDRFAFREVNNRLKDCVKIKNPGESKFEPGKIITKDAYQEVRAALEAEDKKPPSSEHPVPATCSTQLLGITKAAVQSDSFISAASFQETTKVLTEYLSGKVDASGRKENDPWPLIGRYSFQGTEAEVHLSNRRAWCEASRGTTTRGRDGDERATRVKPRSPRWAWERIFRDVWRGPRKGCFSSQRSSVCDAPVAHVLFATRERREEVRSHAERGNEVVG